MMLHRLFGGWRVGVCWPEWREFGLSVFDDGAWLLIVGPFGLYHEKA